MSSHPEDRRRSPRVEILGRVHGHLVSLNLPVTVREISLGGLSLETPFPFETGTIHEFRLRLGDDSVVTLHGRIVYCRGTSAGDAPAVYVTGVQFLEDEPAESASAVGDVLKKIT